MTNEEKARELMKDGDVFTRGDIYAFVDDVAKWKDEQWRAILDRVMRAWQANLSFNQFAEFIKQNFDTQHPKPNTL